MNDINWENPRQEIEKAIAASDLRKLLRISGMLHGHFCPFSALGVKAAVRAVKELKAKSEGMEEVIAIVETNNCFSDGVQIVTGCSFGNNALIYKDFGKTAFTLAKRSGEGIRISVRADRAKVERSPEVSELWERVVVKHSNNEEDSKRLRKLWAEIAFKVLDLPDEGVFDISNIRADIPSYAHIFPNVRCSLCGENVMEPRARIKDGKPICLSCSHHEYYQLAGDGITTARH